MSLSIAESVAQYLSINDRAVFSRKKLLFSQLCGNMNWGFVFDQEKWMGLAYDIDASMKWAAIIGKLSKIKKYSGAIRVLEIAPGASEAVIRALAVMDGRFEYCAVNDNILLSQKLRETSKKYIFPIDIVNADIMKEGGTEKYDVVVLHHALNDIFEYDLCFRNGIDVTVGKWESSRIERFRLVDKSVESHGMDYFKVISNSLLRRVASYMEKDSLIIANHCCFQNEVKDGYNYYANNNYIKSFREVAKSSDIFDEVWLDQDMDWWFAASLR